MYKPIKLIILFLLCSIQALPQNVATKLKATNRTIILFFLYFTFVGSGNAQIIETFAGTGVYYHCCDSQLATIAQLNLPQGVTVDEQGNVYIADRENYSIRKIDTSGIITIIAGTGPGGWGFTGDGGPATLAKLNQPTGVKVDALGNIYIADMSNCAIRKVDKSGIITTIAGNGTVGSSGDGGAATSAQLNYPVGIEIDAQGNIYIADTYNNTVRRVDTSGIITTIAGNGTAGYSGDGGAATSAQLDEPSGVEVDPLGNIYIADRNNNVIRKVDTSGIITTIAGNGTSGYSGDGGVADSAQLKSPYGVEIDAQGNIYIADYLNQRIRKVDTSGIITTFAGGGAGGDSISATLAQLSFLTDVEVDAQGNVYIAEKNAYRIRKVDTSGIITTIAGSGGYSYSGDGGAATSAQINNPNRIDVDTQGNVYFVDEWNYRIRKVDTYGIITTIAGTGTSGFSGDGGPADTAQLGNVWGVASDIQGNVYVVSNNRIRKIDTSGIITTFAGDGSNGYSGDGGVATSAQLSGPMGVEVDTKGNVYIADASNNCIRMVDTAGIITTIAGTGTAGYSGDGGAATSAQFDSPWEVAVDEQGNVYVGDIYNNRIRKVDTSGIITTIAGNGTAGFSGDNGSATSAQLNYPLALDVDAQGNVYFCDASNYRIRKVDTSGIISTIAGNGGGGYAGDGGPATSANFSWLIGIAVDLQGNVYIGDQANNRIRIIVKPALTLAYIPDTNFRNFLTSTYPTFMSGDSLITDSAATITWFTCDEQYVVNFEGLQYFVNANSINIGNNWTIKSIPDLSNLTNLGVFNCFNCNLDQLPTLALNSALYDLDCSSNNIKSLPDLSGTSLSDLNFKWNKLSLPPKLPATLVNIFAGDNLLNSIPDLSSQTSFTGWFGCANNKLDFSDARELLIADTTAGLLDNSPQNPFGNKDTLSGAENGSLTLKVNFQDSATSYQWYHPDGSKIPGATDTSVTLTNLQFSDSGNYFCRSYGTALSSLTKGTPIDSFQSETKMVYVLPDLTPAKVYIPDSIFRNYLINKHPTFFVGDSLVTDSAKNYPWYLWPNAIAVMDFEGLQYFESIKDLDISSSSGAAIPSLKNLTKLETLNCSFSDLDSMPSLGSKVLREIYCWNNNLTAPPDVSFMDSLYQLDVPYNQLTKLPDFSNNNILGWVNAMSNELTELPDFSGKTSLTTVIMDANRLDFSDAREWVIIDKLPIMSLFNYTNQQPFGNRDTITVSQDAILNLTIANQDSALSYQWFRADSTKISGETDTMLTIPNIQFADSGSYFCRSYGTALSNMINGAGIDSFQSETKMVYVIPAASCTSKFGPVIDSLQGCSPLLAQFTDSSLGSIATWSWNFGDGSAVNPLQNPTHIFTGNASADTTYIVSLTVTCSDSTTHSSNSTVTVFGNPNVSFVPQVADYYVNDTICFNNSSDSAAGYSYLWDFGDTNSSALFEPCHSYSFVDTFQIILQVTDANSCQDYSNYTLVISSVDSCNVVWSVAISLTPETCLGDSDGGSSISISGGTSPYNYYWSNGATSSSINSIASGVYSVSITDANLCDTVFSVQIDTLNSSSCDLVWPGDVNMDLVANHFDLFGIGLNYKDSGPVRPTGHQNTNWYAHPGFDWNQLQHSGNDKKHADCDGDGTIDVNDVQAILMNFSLIHSKRQRSASSMSKTVEIIVIVQDDDVFPGSTVTARIMAGNDSVAIYGLGFTIGIDPNFIETDSLKLTFENNWLGTNDPNFLTFDYIENASAMIHGSCVRTDNTAKSGYGEIGQITFKTKDNLTDGTEIIINIIETIVITETGDTIETDNVNDTVKVIGTGISSFDITSQIKVYPNPTTGNVTIEIPPNCGHVELRVFNILGEEINTLKDINECRIELDLSQQKEGIYILNINSDSMVYYKKLELIYER